MSLSYINWYLVELRRRLHQLIPLDEENSFIQETKNHLESLTEEFQQQGMDAKAAEIAAIERFGLPDPIASECLIGYRRQREKRFIQFVSVLAAIWITDTIVDATKSIVGYPYVSGYGMALAPIVILLGLYALVLGKIPPRQWFAVPLGLIIVLGLWTGYTKTYFSVPGHAEEVANYHVLHDQYLSLRTLHLQASNTEHATADSLRASLGSARHLAKGENIQVSSIKYVSQNIDSQSYDSRLGVYTDDYYGTTLSGNSQRLTFRDLPVAKSLDLTGPMTSHDVRTVVLKEISNMQGKMSRRQQILTAMQSGLNVPVKQRMQTFAAAEAWVYFFVILPLSWIASFFLAKVRSRIRFNTEKLLPA